MPELRRDPVVGYWTIMASERGRRPVENRPKQTVDLANCPFCEGHESETTPEIDAIRKPGSKPNGPGWDARVILSKMPILSNANKTIERYGQGIYDLMDGVGDHEVIIETPRHREDFDEMTPGAVEKVIALYLKRFQALSEDPRFKYSLLFKNHGLMSGSAGSLIRHSRSQIISMPITPKRVKEELLSTKNYFERRDRCVFCDVLRQETAEGVRLVMQNESFVAFCPFASRAPFEIWILPKKHACDFWKLQAGDIPAFAKILRECLAKLRALLSDPPYNFILHTAPYRHKKKEVYWKTIEEDYHWYLRISPHLTRPAGFEWGTGIHINATPPEDAAQLLRETQVSL